jgi:predicted helicase
LLELDSVDLAVPVAEIRNYLTEKYESRFQVHPRLFEEVVASVFKDMGYEASITSYSSDGGIDVILQRGFCKIGVQVKRHKNSIKVEQIRSLAGALVLGNLTRGIFVTTSCFQSGVKETLRKYQVRGYKIDLVDAPRFFSALNITRRPKQWKADEFDVDKCLRNSQTVIDCLLYDSDGMMAFESDGIDPPYFHSIFE